MIHQDEATNIQCIQKVPILSEKQETRLMYFYQLKELKYLRLISLFSYNFFFLINADDTFNFPLCCPYAELVPI